MPWKYGEKIKRQCAHCFSEFETVFPTKIYCGAKCQEKRRTLELRTRFRKAILDFFGNKCAHCGFSDPRALQIDHVDGGGVKELHKVGGGIQHYRNVLKVIDSGKYQLLCANCNWIKRHENNEK